MQTLDQKATQRIAKADTLLKINLPLCNNMFRVRVGLKHRFTESQAENMCSDIYQHCFFIQAICLL